MEIRDLELYSSTRRAGGIYISIASTSYHTVVTNVRANNAYIVFYVAPDAPAASPTLTVNTFTSWNHKDTFMLVDNCSGIHLKNIYVWVNPLDQATRGIRIRKGAGFHFDHVQIMGSGLGMAIDPSAGNYVKHMFLHDFIVDTCDDNAFTCTGDGYIESILCEDLWLGNNDGHGLFLYDAPELKTFIVSGGRIRENGLAGVRMGANGGMDVLFDGVQIGGNGQLDSGGVSNAGLSISGGEATLSNCILSDTVETVTGNQDYGIYMTAGTLYVYDNLLQGNVTAPVYYSGGTLVCPEKFIKVSDPDGAIGTHPAVVLPDGADTPVYDQLYMPLSFQQIISLQAVIVSGGTGDMRRYAASSWGLLGTDDYDTSADSLVGAQVAVTADKLELIDISALFTGIVAGELAGFTFTREATNVADTVNADCYYLGIRVRYV